MYIFNKDSGLWENVISTRYWSINVSNAIHVKSFFILNCLLQFDFYMKMNIFIECDSRYFIMKFFQERGDRKIMRCWLYKLIKIHRNLVGFWFQKFLFIDKQKWQSCIQRKRKKRQSIFYVGKGILPFNFAGKKRREINNTEFDL